MQLFSLTNLKKIFSYKGELVDNVKQIYGYVL